jgi:2-polyprenyl-3-methyl-5-hydroxy-6-metoxy-1,4-benzoquinol methylase
MNTVESRLETLQVGVRQHVTVDAPELDRFFDDYLGEAVFGAAIIAPDLAPLPVGARILEIGAGTLTLSCALQQAGFRVTALEPEADGSSRLGRLRDLVARVASEIGAVPDVLRLPAEQLTVESEFDLAFSINVMEHVRDVATVLRQVLMAVRPGCGYRFVCPNYIFPYEPHFNIPTLFSKTLTERVFRRRIESSQNVVDPAGTWACLNWISVTSIRRICRELGVHPTFDRGILRMYLTRALDDPSFQRRRGESMGSILRVAGRIGIPRLAGMLPPVMQPALSCRIVRNSISAGRCRG